MNARWLTALIVSVIVLVISYLVFSQAGDDDQVVTVKAVKEPDARVRTAARATMLDCRKVGDVVEVTGSVRNLGTRALAKVTVQSIWKDANGTVLDTGIVYAVGEGEPLAPGKELTFSDTTSLRAVGRCNVRVLDYWGVEDLQQVERNAPDES